MTVAAAPAFFALSTLSTNAMSPREITATFPFTSFPSKSSGFPSPTGTNSYFLPLASSNALSFGKPITSAEA